MRSRAIAGVIAILWQSILCAQPATINLNGKTLLGIPYDGPDGPPDDALQRDWYDLQEQGGCSIPDPKYIADLKQRYSARLAEIRSRLIVRYGEERMNRDVIIAGACRRSWRRPFSQARFEADLEYWEACLGIKASDRVGICPL